MISNIIKNIMEEVISDIKIPAYRFTIVTTVPGETFAPPFEITGTYDCNINWGDGSNDDITVWNQAEVTHPYATPGTHEIAITGTIIGWRFNNGGDCAKYYETKSVGPLRVGNSGGYWYGCVNHTWTATDILDLTGTTNGFAFFRTNSALTEISSINSWDWLLVPSPDSAFQDCGVFDQDLSGMNVSSFVSAINMFAGSTLSVANYNALILSWSAQAQTIVMNFHGGNSKYTTGGAVMDARNAWIAKGTTITDGGENVGSELFTTNAGFEIGGTGGDFNGGAEVDDGTSDDFDDWAGQGVNDGNGDKVEATATNHDGTYALKITRVVAGSVAVQSPSGGITVVPGTTYKFSFYTRGDGTISGGSSIYDRTNSAYILSPVRTSITGAVYTEMVYFFDAPVGCTAIDLNFRVIDTGVAYFDAVSVKECL